MATIKGKNWSFKDPKDEGIVSNDTIEMCNCSQAEPDTTICDGLTGLTFRDCNLCNCSLPSGTIVENSNTKQMSFCTNLEPNWPNTASCVASCVHVIDTDEITIDGVLVDTIYHYAHIRGN